MKKRGFGPGVGSASILMIFVTLCLTTFAVLSLASAAADLRLAQQAADSLTRYYEADARACALLTSLSGANGQKALLLSCRENGLSAEETRDGVTVSGSVEIDENRRLDFSALFSFEGERFHPTVTKWLTVPCGEWEGDESHPLFAPNALEEETEND